jgi:hypothetical protein
MSSLLFESSNNIELYPECAKLFRVFVIANA